MKMAASSSTGQVTTQLDLSGRQKIVESRKAVQQCASPVNSEGSVFSDSDNANFSSANSTLSFGKHGKTSHREALATLDFFLSDVSQTTEKVKQEEEEKLLSVKNEQPCSTEKLDIVVGPPPEDSTETIKSWKSLPSILDVDDEYQASETSRQKSLSDVRAYGNTSDGELELSPHEKKKKVHAQNKASKAGSSMSSQTSDHTPLNNAYGLQQLNQLCVFLEQYEHLKQQNTALTKRVSNLETRSAVWGRSTDNKTVPKRYSASFLAPADKPPKKVKPMKLKASNQKQANKEKIVGKTKYLATLPFILAAKSVDSLKPISSHNVDRSRAKTCNETKTHSYAADDMEIGKSLHDLQQPWRNSSVKSPNGKSKDMDYHNSDSTEEEILRPCLSKDETLTATPLVVVTEEDSPMSEVDSCVQESSGRGKEKANIKMESLPKPRIYSRSKSEERNTRSTRKMTEWTTLQQAFPTPQIDTNIDLLGQLELILSSNKHHSKKSSHLPNLRVRSGRSRKPKSPTQNVNMFLPPTETPGFTSTFLAAHAMANQLTVTLNLNEIELLSNPDNDTSTPQSFNGQPISIS